MPRLELSLLGPPEMTLDDQPLAGLASNKVRALLIYLAVEHDYPKGHLRRAHRRESLAGLLWPDYPERSARTNLSNALSNLRSALGDREATTPFFHVSREAIQFNDQSDCWVDVMAFGDLVARGEWNEATALYRGPFLEGFSLPDSPPFEQWTLVVRERLQRQTMEALGHLAAEYGEQGDLAQAIQAARRQLEIEPWHESAHRALMRLLALNGQRSAALAQYEACARALWDELGAEPSAETTALYDQIRRGDLAVGEATAQPQPDAEAPPRHNLPVQLTPFVGREKELARLRDLLSAPDVRLLTLVGPGGSGKTRLALEAAARQVDGYPHGTFFVPLAPLQSPETIVPAVGHALRFTFYSGKAPRQQLLDYLREKQMLLVLDNYEHLLAGAGLATDILRAASGVKILTTSRTRLSMRGEQLFPVTGMDVPQEQAVREDGLTPEGTAVEGALQLFAQGARQVQPRFKLTADNLRDVTRICQLVEGMPLAILLAAGWARMLSPVEIADEITESLDFLASDQQDLPERHTSMRAVFDHSWRLLSEHEQEMFAELSVFRGGFTREAAQQVAGASLRDLASLVDRSLLHRTSGGRYEVHELLRQYAAERLDRSPDAGETVRDRHCAYYAAALQRYEADVLGPRQHAAVQEMIVEIENARVAWEWAVERGYVEQLDRAAEGLCSFYHHRQSYHPQAIETMCQVAVKRLLEVATPPPPAAVDGLALRVAARLLVWQSWAIRGSGETGQRDRLQRQSLSLLQASESAGQDVRADRAFLYGGIGILRRGSDRKEARRFFEQSLALYQDLGDRWHTALLLRWLGRLEQRAENYGEAVRLYEESRAMFRSLGDADHAGFVSLFMSEIAYQRGQAERAERLAREDVGLPDMPRTASEPGVPVRTSVLLGQVYALSGEYAKAHSLLQECQAIYAEQADRGERLYYVVPPLSKVKLDLGMYENARTQAQMGLDRARGMRNQSRIGFTLCVLGSVALVEGAHAEAERLLQESIDIYRELGIRAELGRVLACMGYAARGLGQPVQARQHLHEALGIGAEIGAFFPTITTLPAVALLLADQGQVERAIELYGMASRHPYVANSRWFEDVAGKHIATAAAALPPDVVAAAEERGRARELEATVAELLAELTEGER